MFNSKEEKRIKDLEKAQLKHVEASKEHVKASKEQVKLTGRTIKSIGEITNVLKDMISTLKSILITIGVITIWVFRKEIWWVINGIWQWIIKLSENWQIAVFTAFFSLVIAGTFCYIGFRIGKKSLSFSNPKSNQITNNSNQDK